MPSAKLLNVPVTDVTVCPVLCHACHDAPVVLVDQNIRPVESNPEQMKRFK
jgi:NADH:ubiquinone oxidoreductase subunit E